MAGRAPKTPLTAPAALPPVLLLISLRRQGAGMGCQSGCLGMPRARRGPLVQLGWVCTHLRQQPLGDLRRLPEARLVQRRPRSSALRVDRVALELACGLQVLLHGARRASPPPPPASAANRRAQRRLAAAVVMRNLRIHSLSATTAKRQKKKEREYRIMRLDIV